MDHFYIFVVATSNEM